MTSYYDSQYILNISRNALFVHFKSLFLPTLFGGRWHYIIMCALGVEDKRVNMMTVPV